MLKESSFSSVFGSLIPIVSKFYKSSMLAQRCLVLRCELNDVIRMGEVSKFLS